MLAGRGARECENLAALHAHIYMAQHSGAIAPIHQQASKPANAQPGAARNQLRAAALPGRLAVWAAGFGGALEPLVQAGGVEDHAAGAAAEAGQLPIGCADDAVADEAGLQAFKFTVQVGLPQPDGIHHTLWGEARQQEGSVWGYGGRDASTICRCARACATLNRRKTQEGNAVVLQLSTYLWMPS